MLLFVTVLIGACSQVEDVKEGDAIQNDEVMMDDKDNMMDEDSKMADDDVMMDDKDEMMNDNEMMDDEVVVIEIDSFNFGYSQDEIRVKVGQKVKIILTNSDGTHDFVIDELDGRTAVIKAGETSEVEFNVTEAGEYFYYCSIGKHRAAGMEGKLIIEE